MNPLTMLTFTLSLLTATVVVLSSHHWLLAWIGLELNTLAILPLMTKTPHPRAIEAATKYFLMQATASALLLFSALMNAYETGHWDPTSMVGTPTTVLSIALLTKLGLAPMHFWMPEVLQGTPLATGLILSTWQKIAPMCLFLQTHHSIDTSLIVLISLTSIIVGGWGGINQTQLRKMMAFSSIGHFGWIVMVIKFNPQLAMFSFLVYITMTTAMFATLMTLLATSMMDMSTAWPKTPTLTTTAMLTLLSLAGLPPLTGFVPKLLISLELMKQNLVLLTSATMLVSLLALFFYLRLVFIMVLTLSPNSPNSMITWHGPMKANLLITVMTTLALVASTLSPTIMLLM
uniref:NADH-ubiquinone oxidoreductase chain 2 n=1 Tax=Phrynobatrachus latifrons TaxID=689408 RepID=S4V0P5_9NEOB|nr:NADH dehydrogenase subunit 2 [Phrynobatrachus latifrons]